LVVKSRKMLVKHLQGFAEILIAAASGKLCQVVLYRYQLPGSIKQTIKNSGFDLDGLLLVGIFAANRGDRLFFGR